MTLWRGVFTKLEIFDFKSYRASDLTALIAGLVMTDDDDYRAERIMARAVAWACRPEQRQAQKVDLTRN